MSSKKFTLVEIGLIIQAMRCFYGADKSLKTFSSKKPVSPLDLDTGLLVLKKTVDRFPFLLSHEVKRETNRTIVNFMSKFYFWFSGLQREGSFTILSFIWNREKR